MQGETGSEDCLYLNVFAPQGQGPFPVLVWIHGGGNSGGGTLGESGAGLAKEGIVFVSVAYRLGTFGFVEWGDILGREYADSGDNGILDQLQAIRWLRENVAAFGGDPRRITVAGQSAGAKDVAALMALPGAKGMFSRAIMESGSGQTVNTPSEARDVANLFLAYLGLNRGDERQVLELPAQTLLAAQRKVESNYPFNYPFRPYVGGRVLPKRPVDLVDGSVPLLLGTNHDESMGFISPGDGSKPIASREASNISYSRVKEMEIRYRAAFPNATDLERRVALLTAEEYWMPSVRFAEAHSARGGKTWMYRFDHKSTDPRDPRVGFAVHGAEIGYARNPHPGWNMHQTWVAFIKGEDPADWPRYNATRRLVRIYGQNGAEAIEADPNGDERKLWDGVL
jgi:para-nitrobenzyl esterase